jgi:hypothetical protein
MIKAGGSAGYQWLYRVLRDVGKKIRLPKDWKNNKYNS